MSSVKAGSLNDRVSFWNAPALRAYVGIARPDHWIKNIFMIPGAAFAWAVAPHTESLAAPLVALAALCLIASANYTINEYLDAEFDRFHPVKCARAGAMGLLDGRLVVAQYFILAISGLAIAHAINLPFFFSAGLLLLMGIIYNVPPVRSKDRAYLDVLSESINNPIRFLFGWFAVSQTALPPASALLAYWMGGAFLMGVKRYSEYRRINDPSRAMLYRRSFGTYSEESLLLSSFFYAICSAFFIGVFLIKYRVEFVLTFPLFAVLFTWYLAIGFESDSAAQAPEKLYKEGVFMGFAGFTFLMAAMLFFIPLPFLHSLMDPQLIPLNLHAFLH
ncbi:MAG TPA: UbiA family prenyltransferase [Rhizomicrobium sp.]|jgi:4-hydroxybenzoate polyprenyltransferase|nr:UbiA family prenyltransferase [Rhizomicrobium sp.]